MLPRALHQRPKGGRAHAPAAFGPRLLLLLLLRVLAALLLILRLLLLALFVLPRLPRLLLLRPLVLLLLLLSSLLIYVALLPLLRAQRFLLLHSHRVTTAGVTPATVPTRSCC